jgi:hypothetical protein
MPAYLPVCGLQRHTNHVVGISEHCGHALTYKVPSSESNVIIYCSLLRPATPEDDNVRACMSGGKHPVHNGTLKDRSTIDKSKPASIHTDGISSDPSPPPVFNPETFPYGQTGRWPANQRTDC